MCIPTNKNGIKKDKYTSKVTKNKLFRQTLPIHIIYNSV